MHAQINTAKPMREDKRRRRGKDSPSYRESLHVAFSCPCGYQGTAYAHEKRKFCSNACRHRFRAVASGQGHGNWSGGCKVNRDGYLLVSQGAQAYKLEHIIVAEAAIGKPLPTGAVVHHINEIKTDNRPSNLVICQDRAYHMSLHKRLRAVRRGEAAFA